MQQVEPAGPAAPESALKIVVIDDDPTGSQTVHGCPLLLRWDAASLNLALRQPSPLLFLLANTRALDPDQARQRLRQICRALGPALAAAQAEGVIDRWLVVSRGDSTLRGHFPLEMEVISEELGPFDATLLVPAFLEGGRTTLAGVHRLHGQPVHETAFARDGLFGFGSSFLPAWVEEKSGGRIAATAVQRLDLAVLEGPAPALGQRLAGLEGNVVVAVDATEPRHLSALAAAVRAVQLAPALKEPLAAGGFVPEAAAVAACFSVAGPDTVTGAAAADRSAAVTVAADTVAADPSIPATISATPADQVISTDTGTVDRPTVDRPTVASTTSAGPPRRFLFQSAAGLIAALADLPPQPLEGAALAALRRSGVDGPLPGLVLVGSHVLLADRQLGRLLAEERCGGVEVAVAKVQRLLEGPLPEPLLASLESGWLEQLRQQLAAGRTPVLHTSRGELRCRDDAERRRLGLVLAGSMARLVAALAPQLGYVISKGGITTHTLLADGLEQAAVRLQGQLLPGLSLVLVDLPAERPGELPAALPVLTFPGNLGDDDTLLEAWRCMEGGAPLT
ncbi:MAG: four-carbon acid sugar kinase family protein [Cyanobium sp.]